MIRVVILGGGFGGVYCAQRLVARAKHVPGGLEVHLVNRENYMTFQPMLGEVISGNVGLADTVSPLRRLVPGAHVHVREVESVDRDAKQVICSPGFKPRPLTLQYDHLVVALGNVTDFRGQTGLADHALPFKTLGDALALRNHVVHILEEADGETDLELRQALLTFVVAGGGFSGIECIAEMQDFVRRALASYPSIKLTDCRFVLVHSRDLILPEMDPKLAQYAQNILLKRKLELKLNARLSCATAHYAVLADGTKIPTRTLVSTVPSSPNRVVEALGLPMEHNALKADSTMLVEGSDHIWAVGDCAHIPLPNGTIAPPTAQHATREATLCADNILASLAGKPRKPFTFMGLGSLAALGHREGVANLMGVRVSGLLAWLTWRTIYWAKMPGLDRKARVGASWALELLFPPDLVQLRAGNSKSIRQAHYEPGEVVFDEGDLGDKVYIIVSGRAEIVQQRDGQTKKLAELGPGQYFGEMALLNRCTRNATVRCLERMDVLMVEKGDFGALVGSLAGMRSSFENEADRRALADT